MIKVRDTSVVQQWVYKNPEDGFVISHFGDFPAISAKVKTYRRANSLPIGSNFSEQLEANLCQNLPNACIDAEEISLAQKAATLARAMYQWSKQGFPLRNKTELESVQAICNTCEFYSGETGLFRIACKKCGCTRLKQNLASSHCPIGKW